MPPLQERASDRARPHRGATRRTRGVGRAGDGKVDSPTMSVSQVDQVPTAGDQVGDEEPDREDRDQGDEAGSESGGRRRCTPRDEEDERKASHREALERLTERGAVEPAEPDPERVDEHGPGDDGRKGEHTGGDPTVHGSCRRGRARTARRGRAASRARARRRRRSGSGRRALRPPIPRTVKPPAYSRKDAAVQRGFSDVHDPKRERPRGWTGLPAARLEQFFWRNACGLEAEHRLAEPAGDAREDLGVRKCVVASTIAFAREEGSADLKIPEPTKTPSAPSCMHSAASAGVAIPPAVKVTTGSRPCSATHLTSSYGARSSFASA